MSLAPQQRQRQLSGWEEVLAQQAGGILNNFHFDIGFNNQPKPPPAPIGPSTAELVLLGFGGLAVLGIFGYALLR